ncbi:hypothetical protein BDY17DRAFT_16588 [Neohortaea acidophila]|uniref:Extracellular membrane protein CFEM domain-containing protein n=1 Tax=Neohortaea acidophila TaxID=245834 RepID=A0A6A6Q6M7_9PEZI|nr:uncharacterized protein BDY17DRAFT_16588 [Neohortaea acidophila]KAF2487689.1 hypothetical protein BDY17DRAFT_16588 [Neohortaea acidophila]
MLVFLGLFLLSTLATADLAAVSCPAQASCTGFVGSIASALKGYPQASTFCSDKFPVPSQTCTSVAPTLTITVTAVAATATTTVATNTITDTASTITNTATITVTPTITTTTVETDSETDTTTVTATITSYQSAINKRDRHGERGGDPRSSKLKSLQSEASSFVGAVCTCLETPASTTATITPTTNTTVTPTVTTRVTQTTTR